MSRSLFPDTSTLTSRLLSGGAWALGSKVGGALVYLGVNALLARLLSPADLGTYFLAFSVVVLLASVGELGLGRAAVRLVAESMGLGDALRGSAVVRVVLQLGILGALLTGTFFVAVGGLTSHLFHAPALATITLPVALWIAFTVLQRVVTEVFRGFHEIRLASLFGRTADAITPAVIQLLILALLWWLEAGTLISVTLASVTGTLVTVMVAGYLLQRHVRPLFAAARSTYSMAFGRRHLRSMPNFRNVLATGLPMLVTNLTAFALSYQLDLWLLGMFQSQNQVALYGAAARLVFVIAAPLMIINAVVPPIIAELDAKGSKLMLERVLRAAASIGSLVAFSVLGIFSVAGGPLLGLLFGDYYEAAALVLLLLGLGQALGVASGSCGMTLLMTGNETKLMQISILMTFVAVVSGLLAALFLGAAGLAAVSAGRIFLQNVIMILAVKRLVGVRTYVDPTLRSAVTLLRQPVS